MRVHGANVTLQVICPFKTVEAGSPVAAVASAGRNNTLAAGDRRNRQARKPRPPPRTVSLGTLPKRCAESKIFIYLSIYLHIYIYIYTAYAHTCVLQVCKYMYAYTYTDTYMCVYIYIYIYICMRIHVINSMCLYRLT